VINEDTWGEEEDVDPVIMTQNGDVKTLWLARPSDPELEIEMLQNFMIYLGLDEDAVSDELSVYSNKKVARIISKDKGLALEVKENFPRTWRRIGLALDRMGFVVEDRNRSAGVYYISLPDKYETSEEKTWFEKLFNKDRNDIPHDYLLSISGKGDATYVMLKNRSDKTLDDKVVEKILRQIQAHIS
jgi:outer membrane protein assembly factor BamC